MWCKDPLLDALKSVGYSVVRFPRADLEPMQLLVRSGRDLERLGPLDSVFLAAPQVPAPPITRDENVPDIQGRRTGSLDLGVGLDLLGSFLAAMGGVRVGLDAAYVRARGVVFAFTHVEEHSVAVAALDACLFEARLLPHSHHLASLLDGDDVYVTTMVLKSRSFTVTVTGQDGAELAVDAPLVQDIVGGQVSVSRDDSHSTALTYRGRVPLGFGFRAVRLCCDEGRYTAFEPLAPGDAAITRASRAPGWLPAAPGFAHLRG